MTARVSFGDRLRRLGWAVLWLVVFVVVGTAGTLATSGVLVWAGVSPVDTLSPWGFAANAAAVALSFAFATWLVGVRLTKHSWDQLGWRAGRSGAAGCAGDITRWVVPGGALGAGMAVLAIVLTLVGSDASVELTPDGSHWAAQAAPLAGGLLLAALGEELVFRGLPLRLLADAVGSVGAMLVLALGFGIAHLKNPHAGLLGTVNVGLAAIWLSFAFFSAGGMALAWGLHFGWNAGLALLFDAPVSGLTFQVPAVEYRPGVRAWVDGGAFGPEGGLAATIALVAGTLVVLGRRVRRPREWLA
jgi:uncharacterized protein